MNQKLYFSFFFASTNVVYLFYRIKTDFNLNSFLYARLVWVARHHLFFSRVKPLVNQYYLLVEFNDNPSKVIDIILKKYIHFYVQCHRARIHIDLVFLNYNYINQFKFWLSLYPMLKLTLTPFSINSIWMFYYHFIKNSNCLDK